MARPARCDFTLYDREPLMRALVALGATPVKLGVGFFIVVSLVLTVWATSGTEPADDKSYLSFFENVSWSLSNVPPGAIASV